MIKSIPPSLIETASRTLMEHQGFEDWLHVEHRKLQVPQAHLSDIIHEHEKMGWKLYDDVDVAHTAPMNAAVHGPGCYKSVHMIHPDGHQVVMHVKFGVPQHRPTKEYKIRLEHKST